MSLQGKTGIVYSTIPDRCLLAEWFKREEPWKGRSFYVKDQKAHVEDGLVYQTLRGVNRNEAWLLKCEARNVEGKLRLSFLDSDNSLISTKTRRIKSSSRRYFSTYGVALKGAQKLLARFEGNGVLLRLGVSQLKASLVLGDWQGVIGRKNDREFQRGNIGRKFFRGRAEEIRILENVNFETFKGRDRVFLGFMENDSIVKRVEGSIEDFSPSLSHRIDGPVDFRCCPAKVIIDDWGA